MLALARVLRMGARLLLLDEPTEGLAPVSSSRSARSSAQIKEHGVTVLLVEQNVQFAATVADRHYLLAQGRVVESLDNDDVPGARERAARPTSACSPSTRPRPPRPATTATPPVHRATAPWETA